MVALASTTDLDNYLSGDQEAILDQASAAVRSYCGWHIAPVETDQTITVDGHGGSRLRLPTGKLIDVAEVRNDDALIPADQLWWSTFGWIERDPGCWTTKPNGVTATITHGYDTVPDDIVEVVVSVAARAAASPTGATREQAGSVSFTWSTVAPGVAGGIGFLAHELAILDTYRLAPSA